MTELELLIDGPEGAIPARTFVRIVDQGLNLLRDLDLAAAQRGTQPARWLVGDLRTGSLRIRLRPEAQDERDEFELSRPAQDLVHGIGMLQHNAVVPDSFTTASLDKVISLGRQISRNNVAGISFARDDGRARVTVGLTPEVIVHAEDATNVRDTALGSAQGFLDVISIREKRRHVSLYDPVRRRGLYCTYPTELWSRLRDALGSEIRAWGSLRRNSAGQAVRLDIEDFALVEPQRLVPVSELTGVAPWWIGGHDPVEYVRRARGA